MVKLQLQFFEMLFVSSEINPNSKPYYRLIAGPSMGNSPVK